MAANDTEETSSVWLLDDVYSVSFAALFSYKSLREVIVYGVMIDGAALEYDDTRYFYPI